MLHIMNYRLMVRRGALSSTQSTLSAPPPARSAEPISFLLPRQLQVPEIGTRYQTLTKPPSSAAASSRSTPKSQ